MWHFCGTRWVRRQKDLYHWAGGLQCGDDDEDTFSDEEGEEDGEGEEGEYEEGEEEDEEEGDEDPSGTQQD